MKKINPDHSRTQQRFLFKVFPAVEKKTQVGFLIEAERTQSGLKKINNADSTPRFFYRVVSLPVATDNRTLEDVSDWEILINVIECDRRHE